MIQYIATEKPPSLNSVAKEMTFSNEFQNFIARCINSDAGKRPTAKQLKKHPWIKKSRKSGFDIKKWIQKNKLVIKTPSAETIQNAIDGFNQ